MHSLAEDVMGNADCLVRTLPMGACAHRRQRQQGRGGANKTAHRLLPVESRRGKRRYRTIRTAPGSIPGSMRLKKKPGRGRVQATSPIGAPFRIAAAAGL